MASLIHRFFQRGGTWILSQGALIATLLILSLRFPGANTHWAVKLVGMILLGSAAVVAIAGALAIGANLTPFPKPREKGSLVQDGIFRLIRHPLYSSAIAAGIGWALICGSWPALAVALAQIPLLRAKALREEKWLRETFPEYAGYERRTRRFLPWLY